MEVKAIAILAGLLCMYFDNHIDLACGTARFRDKPIRTASKLCRNLSHRLFWVYLAALVLFGVSKVVVVVGACALLFCWGCYFWLVGRFVNRIGKPAPYRFLLYLKHKKD